MILIQPYMCDHANECPVNCVCPPDCYCRLEGSCRNMSPLPYITGPIYGVHSSGDDYTSGPIIAYFSTAARAAEFGKKKGAYGGDAQVTQKWSIRLPQGEVFVLEKMDPVDIDLHDKLADEALLQNVLNRLNPEEKRVLDKHLSGNK